MKSFAAFALGLAAGVAAHEHMHQHLHHQRAATGNTCAVSWVTTVSTGEWQLVPETSSSSSAVPTSSSSPSSSAPPPPPTSSSVWSPPPPPPTTSSSAPPPPPPTTSSSAPPPPPPSSSAAPATSSAAPPNVPAPLAPLQSAVNSMTGGGSSGSISPNGNQWAFCYTPYTTTGDCKTAAEVSSDISSLKQKGFNTIRTYAADCSGIQNIGAACQANSMKLVLGIDLGQGIGSYTDGQISDIISFAQSDWSIVEMIVVGNEAIFSGQCSSSDMVNLIGHVKQQVQSAGYNGPVTTTEPLGTIQQYGSVLCPAVDVIAANIHPFFNDAIAADGAGAFVSSQIALLAGVCSNQKQAYCLETGWPSGGSNNGAAVPSTSNQQTAISQIMSAAGSKVAMFSFQNDTWKAPGEFGVEQYWGAAQLFN